MTNKVDTITTLSASALFEALKGDAEIALLDSRDEAIYDTGHLLMASCVPLSRLELMLPPLVPTTGTRIVWYDNGDGTAKRAAERTQILGYTNIAVLDGGLSAWRNTGFMVYEGVHVPSKAFAEVIEHEKGTPSISVEEFNALTASGADVKLFDTRTVHEYLTDGLPGAFSTPGPEILQHFSDLVTSDHTTVVVHCGGRTRSIIGAQTLIDADVPNKVVSLRNGTQGWRLAGLDVLQRSPDEAPGEPSTEAVAYAIDATKAMAERNGIAVAPYDPDAASLAPTPDRTIYTIDVRSQAEYEAGHVPGFKNVAAGQLVQETDRHLGVWNAHAVLLDDNGVRAICAANFLQQMGWSVEVMTLDDGASTELETGPAPAMDLPASLTVAPSVDTDTLRQMMHDGRTCAIDVDWSRDFLAGHIPGAYWCIRNRINEQLSTFSPVDNLVLTSADGRLAALAATDLMAEKRGLTVTYLSGGTQAWRGAGYPIETGAERLLCPAQDVRMRAREQAPEEREAKMRAYLAWELALAEQLTNDPLCRYQLPAPPIAGIGVLRHRTQPRRKTMTYTLEELSADCHKALEADQGRAGLDNVAACVAKALRDEAFVSEYLPEDAEKPRRVLYEDPEFGFCICAHVNRNPKDSAPHDHGPTWAIYGQAVGETRMTDWEVVSPATDSEPAKVKLSDTYWMKPGDVHVYEPGAVHAPYRSAPTRLIRIEGKDTTKLKRTPIKAIENA